MQIRIRDTAQVMFWNEFRDLLLASNPSELITVAPQTEEWLNEHGADIVFEGPQATGGDRYQYSMRSGVEQIESKWYTKYILGPVFTGESAVEDEAAYIAIKDAEFATQNSNQAKQCLQETDWSENASVRNVAVSPHLTNPEAFDTYRLALRSIVINRPATVEEWPVRPDALWA